MRIDVVTLFPELFGPHLSHGVTRRAFGAGGAIEVRLWQLRDFGDGPHARVDDRPYGGGPGMVMLVEPLERALAAVRAERPDAGEGAAVLHFSPSGERLGQRRVESLASTTGGLFLVCARYEGIDQRFIDRHVDLELSLGDYVLSGGEIPALALLDAMARLQSGVLGDARSHEDESFSRGLVEGPHYSRPEVAGEGDGASVPPVLLSGHHGSIARWRREQAVGTTADRRPDLLAGAEADGRLDAADAAYLASRRTGPL